MLSLCNRYAGLLLCTLGGVLPLQAQEQKEEQQLQLNKDAVKMIQFDFNDAAAHSNDPQVAPVDKKWMNFQMEFEMPRSLLDTTKVYKPTGYIRVEPYTIWTRYGDDPIYDVLVYGRPAKQQYYWKLQPYLHASHEEYGRTLKPSTGKMYDMFSSPVGPGVSIGTDFDKILFETFTARGRCFRHNRIHANAWKTYQSYIPTREDSLKFPHFKRDLNLWAADTTRQNISVATGKKPSSPAEGKPAKDISMEEIYRRMRQQQREDSIHRKEFFRKDKVRQGVYDVEKQIRSIREKQD